MENRVTGSQEDGRKSSLERYVIREAFLAGIPRRLSSAEPFP